MRALKHRPSRRSSKSKIAHCDHELQRAMRNAEARRQARAHEATFSGDNVDELMRHLEGL